MSKAILILNKMPKDCPLCPVAHYNKLDEFTGCDIVGGKRYAMTTEEGYRYTSERPAWCPLKPLGRKVEEYGLETWNTRDGIFLCEKGLFDEIYGDDEE